MLEENTPENICGKMVRILIFKDRYLRQFFGKDTDDTGFGIHRRKNGNLIADLVGCRAVDENGQTVGTLTDVLQHGPVDTWVFRTASGTLMAPALLSVFPAVDPENKAIDVIRERLEEVAVRS